MGTTQPRASCWPVVRSMVCDCHQPANRGHVKGDVSVISKEQQKETSWGLSRERKN